MRAPFIWQITMKKKTVNKILNVTVFLVIILLIIMFDEIIIRHAIRQTGRNINKRDTAKSGFRYRLPLSGQVGKIVTNNHRGKHSESRKKYLKMKRNESEADVVHRKKGWRAAWKLADNETQENNTAPWRHNRKHPAQNSKHPKEKNHPKPLAHQNKENDKKNHKHRVHDGLNATRSRNTPQRERDKYRGGAPKLERRREMRAHGQYKNHEKI